MRGQKTHPDTDVLADFDAGLLTGRRAAVVTAHLAGCARCAAVADELAGVSALFAAAPAPAMPDRVAQQLEAALAAEVANRDIAERFRGTPQREPATPVVPATPAHRGTRPRRAGPGGGFRWLSPRVLASAGGVAVLVGGLYLVTHTGSPQYEGPSSVAGPAVGSAPADHSAASAAASAAGGTAPRQLQMTPQEFTVVVSPVDFQAATLSQQLTADLRVPVSARTRHTASPTVTACVHRVASGAAVLRVESARYEGQPVTVVVTRAAQGEKAQLAGPGCSGASSDVLAARTVPSGISGP